MGIYLNDKKNTNLSAASHKFKLISDKSKKIYQDFVPAGTVLWSGGKAFADSSWKIANDFLLVGQTVKLPYSISQLKNGIKINYSRWLFYQGQYSIWTTKAFTDGGLPIGTTAKFYLNPDPVSQAIITKESLLSKNEQDFVIEYSDTQVGAKKGKQATTSIVMVGDSELSFTANLQWGAEKLINSTAFENQANTYNGWIIIDSIEAY